MNISIRNSHARIIIALAGALVATGCSGDEIKWTEEVKLHDGKVIQVKRRTELTPTGFPVQKRGRPIYHEFCYSPMGIYWKSKLEYRPETFEIVNARAYVRVPLAGCSACMLHGYPESGVLYFMWEAGTWKSIRSGEFPKRLRLKLVQNPVQAQPRDDARGLVSLADKEKLDASLSYELKMTGAIGLNETAAYKGMCAKCKGIQTQTDRTPEVFLPSKTIRCDW